ncbi:MAG: hypothetical protein WBR18_00875 [Anaerolineales bacterium]
MNIQRSSTPLLALAALLIAGLACGPSLNSDQQATLQAVGTQSALATTVAATANSMPAEPTEPPPATSPAEPTAAPAEPTAMPTVVHTTIPTNPGSVSSFMTDRSTRPLATEGRTIGDNFDTLLFERPFSAQAMEYKPYLDITRGELSASGPWFYVTIFLEELPTADVSPSYGVEIDIDKDGRGDWLIYAASPAGSDWTTDGVLALRDNNNNVGDSKPVLSEAPPQSGDGYEETVFDSGQGLDPDAAWIRQSPGSPAKIQIAFKQTLIGPPGEFMWGAWADEGPQEPAWFDYNDHFSIQEAGSPVSNSSYYPLNELAQIDNTCRWGYGFTPTGSEPGACYIPPTPTPEPQGSISGFVYRGGGATPSSERFGGVTVTLGQGSCTSNGYKTASTGGNGGYTFSSLPAGTYCVTIVKSSLPPASYGWSTQYPGGFSPTINPYQQVTIGPNEDKTGVNFAFIEIVG